MSRFVARSSRTPLMAAVALLLFAASLVVVTVRAESVDAADGLTFYEVDYRVVNGFGVNDDGDIVGTKFIDGAVRLVKYNPTDGVRVIHDHAPLNNPKVQSNGGVTASGHPKVYGVTPGGQQGSYGIPPGEDFGGPTFVARDLAGVGNIVDGGDYKGLLWSGLDSSPIALPGVDSPIAINANGDLVIDTGARAEYGPTGQSYGKRLSPYSIVDFRNDGGIVTAGPGYAGELIAPGGSFKSIPFLPKAANADGVIVGEGRVVVAGNQVESRAMLRDAEGVTSAMQDILDSRVFDNGSRVIRFHDARSVSDNCHVMGTALVQRPDASEVYTTFVAELPECGVEELAGSVGMVDSAATKRIEAGEKTTLRVRVENQTDQPVTNLRSVDDGTILGTDDIDSVDIVLPDQPRLSPTLAGNSTNTFDFDVTVAGRGTVEFSFDIAGTAASGANTTVTVEGSFKVEADLLEIELTPDLRRPDGSAPELNVDNDGDGDVDLDDHRFDVVVEIKNTADEPVTDLAFSDEAEPIDFSNNLVGGDQGAPKLTLLGVRGMPADDAPEGEKGPIEPLDVAIPDLAEKGDEGDTHEVTFVYEATGEIDASSITIVRGKIGDDEARGSAELDIVFTSGLLVEFATKLADGPRLTTSGQVVRIDGYVENLDEDEVDGNGVVTEEAQPIVVWISPLTDGNAGGGHLVARDGRTPQGAEPIVVQPGERRTINGILTTTPSKIRTDAEVEYRINAWHLPEEGAESAMPLAAERIDIVEDEERGYSPAISQRLQFADFTAQDLKACETLLYDAIVTCNFYEGLKSLVVNTKDAAKMAGTGLVEIARAGYHTKAWAVHQLADVARVMVGDPAAQQRLATELQVQFETWRQMGVLGKDTAIGAVAALDSFFREADRVLSEGDVDAGLAWVSKFAGENPDLLFSALLKGRALAAMGQSALEAETRSVAGTVVREAMEAEAKGAGSQLASKVDEALGRGLDPKQPSSGVLKSGVDVTDTPKVWRDVYGAARQDLDNLLRIAKEEGILIAFRSRNPISIQLLETGKAWLKPQSVKAKNVNAIDVAYLNFPQDSFGKVVMMEPPIDFTLTGGALDDALDAHMATLKRNHPELADPVFAGEVRDRLKMRTKKYQEHLSEWLEFGREGMPVGFGYADNGVTSGRDVSELRRARVEITEVPNRYGTGTVKRFDLKIAGEGGLDFRHLTGDIDIVGFFNLDRTPIMGAARRERIYEKMRSLVGMQHGETLTWDHVKRSELLREHVGPDAEMLMVASPNERLYASLLDEKKSTAVSPGDNYADTFTLLDGPPIELLSPARGPGPIPAGGLVSIADRIDEKVQAAQPFLLPANLIENIGKIKAGYEGIKVDETQKKDTPPVVVRPDGTVVIYRLPETFTGDADPAARRSFANATTKVFALASAATEPWMLDIEAILGGYEHAVARPEIGAAGGGWETIGMADALALGDAALLELPLGSWTDKPIVAGDTTVSVLTADDLGVPGGDWFAPGDRAVVDPGGLYEQFVEITEVEGHLLTVSEPLSADQPEGVHVLAVRDAAEEGGGEDGGDGGTGGETGGGTSGGTTGPGTTGDGPGNDPTPAGKAAAGTVRAAPGAPTASGALAFTGAEVWTMVRLAVALLVIGGGFVIVQRRRRTVTSAG